MTRAPLWRAEDPLTCISHLFADSLAALRFLPNTPIFLYCGLHSELMRGPCNPYLKRSASVVQSSKPPVLLRNAVPELKTPILQPIRDSCSRPGWPRRYQGLGTGAAEYR